ncbi:MAG: PqqD family protein [Acutalibacteraceae bacterium]|nr:PqqD family protein [Acutalibacteraceae bacterium]
MFIIDTILLSQFKPFEKRGGLLPSFLIKFHDINYTNNENVREYLHSLSLDKTIGDYNFYKSTNDEICISLGTSYVILNKEMTIANLYCFNCINGFIIHDLSYLLMQAYMYRLVSTNNIMIHAAAVIYQNQGILFCGVSGAGKSTQANLWKKYLKAEILNYDKPCIIKNNSKYYVSGSPWSGKEGVYKNEYVDIRSIVFVNKSSENRIKKCTPSNAYAYLYLNNYVYPVTKEIEEMYHNVVYDLSLNVPIYNIYCDISERAVVTLFDELFIGEDYYKVKKECPMVYKVRNIFMMKKIADEYIVTPRGTEAVDFSATVVFNETGAFLWNQLLEFNTLDNLAEKLSQKYDIDIDTAKADCNTFIEKLSVNGMLEKR